MSSTKHSRVLSALEHRALRYRNKGQHKVDNDQVLYENALDVSTANFTDSNDASIDTRTTEQQETEESWGVKDELLQVHGMAPGKKLEGVTRLVFENPNGFV